MVILTDIFQVNQDHVGTRILKRFFHRQIVVIGDNHIKRRMEKAYAMLRLPALAHVVAGEGAVQVNHGVAMTAGDLKQVMLLEILITLRSQDLLQIGSYHIGVAQEARHCMVGEHHANRVDRVVISDTRSRIGVGDSLLTLLTEHLGDIIPLKKYF